MSVITKQVKYISSQAPPRGFSIPFEDWMIPYNDSTANAILLDGTIFVIGLEGIRYITKRREGSNAVLELLNLNGNTLELIINTANPIQATVQEIAQATNPCGCGAGSAADCVDELLHGPNATLVNLGPFSASVSLLWNDSLFLPVKPVAGWWEIRTTIPLSGRADALMGIWSYQYSAQAAGNAAALAQHLEQYDGIDAVGGVILDFTKTQTLLVYVEAGETVDTYSVSMSAQIGSPDGAVSTGTTIACFHPMTALIIGE